MATPGRHGLAAPAPSAGIDNVARSPLGYGLCYWLMH